MPNTERETTAATTLLTTTGAKAPMLKDPRISSSAKKAPASGALKAAEVREVRLGPGEERPVREVDQLVEADDSERPGEPDDDREAEQDAVFAELEAVEPVHGVVPGALGRVDRAVGGLPRPEGQAAQVPANVTDEAVGVHRDPGEGGSGRP